MSLARDEEFPELAKHGLTLDDAASRSDEDLMSLDGIGVATLKKIRARQGNSEG